MKKSFVFLVLISFNIIVAFLCAFFFADQEVMTSMLTVWWHTIKKQGVHAWRIVIRVKRLFFCSKKQRSKNTQKKKSTFLPLYLSKKSQLRLQSLHLHSLL